VVVIDDVEHEITISNPERASSKLLDLPLSSFTGLTTRSHIAQIIFVGVPKYNSLYNVFFYNLAGSVTAAPVPTSISRVISMSLATAIQTFLLII
jgi:hypothetical protein